MTRPLLAVIPLALGLFLGTACTGEDGNASAAGLPDGAALLRDSAQAMGELQTVHFELDIEGTIPGVAIRSAEGDLTREGDVQGTGQLIQGEATSEIEFVIVDDYLYLKGPTGGFQKLPASFAASVYDPSKILDGQVGLPAMVAGATQATTEAAEEVDGTPAYKIAVTVPKDKLSVLLPGVSSDLQGHLWVASADPKRLLRAKMNVPPQGDGQPASVTMTLSGFDEPVTVSPPN